MTAFHSASKKGFSGVSFLKTVGDGTHIGFFLPSQYLGSSTKLQLVKMSPSGVVYCRHAQCEAGCSHLSNTSKATIAMFFHAEGILSERQSQYAFFLLEKMPVNDFDAVDLEEDSASQSPLSSQPGEGSIGPGPATTGSGGGAPVSGTGFEAKEKLNLEELNLELRDAGLNAYYSRAVAIKTAADWSNFPEALECRNFEHAEIRTDGNRVCGSGKLFNWYAVDINFVCECGGPVENCERQGCTFVTNGIALAVNIIGARCTACQTVFKVDFSSRLVVMIDAKKRVLMGLDVWEKVLHIKNSIKGSTNGVYSLLNKELEQNFHGAFPTKFDTNNLQPFQLPLPAFFQCWRRLFLFNRVRCDPHHPKNAHGTFFYQPERK